jgi:hypothetical protein
MRKRKNINTTVIFESKTEFDLTKYNIVYQKFPFEISFYRLYQGDLKDSIQHFERHYGKIDGAVYYNEKFSLIGITGSQVIDIGDYSDKE